MTAMASGSDFSTGTPSASRTFGAPGQYDESGVDLSLIRANMRLTPTERARGRSAHDGPRCGCRRLDEPREQSALERFCAVLAEHGVAFIVVGGQAEALMGSPRVTYDVDLCYRRTPENLERLATALATLNLTLRGAPADLKFPMDAQALALVQDYTLEALRAETVPIGCR